ncbi:hypothetical protein KOR42_22640 [Thalassoglobus neptunius]|uniref:Uncharacterized protein n=1 Tax=Thalassoglobus neptunius TaxID=1938619 RepID=A0A5C5X6Y4_9PLAN|nr:hypothetical protein KOR42_22640 [Thalassoglobus neptunius]
MLSVLRSSGFFFGRPIFIIPVKTFDPNLNATSYYGYVKLSLRNGKSQKKPEPAETDSGEPKPGVNARLGLAIRVYRVSPQLKG